jgi:hypothetical protein
MGNQTTLNRMGWESQEEFMRVLKQLQTAIPHMPVG